MASQFRFHVVDSLTGRISGRLYAREWQWSDPLTGNGSGTVTVPLPDLGDVSTLIDLVRPRVRWIAVEDERGRFPFAGPITARPSRDGDTIVVPFVDWRGWFYRRYLSTVNGGDYIQASVEQTTAMRDLMMRALTDTDEPTVNPLPALVADLTTSTGVNREVTVRALQTSIGDALDDISNREGAPEWWTYVTRTSDTHLLPHVAIAYPERGGASATHMVEHRISLQSGRGGNVSEYTWPQSPESPSRVWATGDGEPPAQPFAYDQLPDVDGEDGIAGDIIWEQVESFQGVTQAATLFDHAAHQLDALASDGQAVITILDERIAVGDLQTGDRTRLLFDDGWVQADLPGVRIIQTRVTGGNGQALATEITIDLTDPEPPSEDEPGEDGIAEEG